MTLKEREKQRIMNMEELRIKCRCPKCKESVYPRRVCYPFDDYSGLLWCPKCLKGEAGMFWVEEE